LKKKGLAKLEKEGDTLFLSWEDPPQETSDEKVIELLKQKESIIMETLDREFVEAANILAKRNLVSKNRKIEYRFTLEDNGVKALSKGIEILKEVSQLTPKLISSGEWRRTNLRHYDVEASVAYVWPGKKQPYTAFLDDLKMKLIAFGFKEMDGPLIELMFFNCDALYMPQDHPARDIHDVYFVKHPQYGSLTAYEKMVNNVKNTHENGWKTGSTGWRYTFSKKVSRRLILRSHGTAISARTLVSEDLEIPGKYFSIARCYRPEITDRTHLTEFNQVEGIVIGKGLTLKDLFGILERFALDIAGADAIKFRPDYFPFTEPSVELLAYKKGHGWMEFGGAGIFRPELTLPLGIEVPVLAWGLGVDRLYMMKSGAEDIRNLFTHDLNWLRKEEIL
jgi:phenylalanyl-tRNA synthetase alpha chain